MRAVWGDGGLQGGTRLVRSALLANVFGVRNEPLHGAGYLPSVATDKSVLHLRILPPREGAGRHWRTCVHRISGEDNGTGVQANGMGEPGGERVCSQHHPAPAGHAERYLEWNVQAEALVWGRNLATQVADLCFGAVDPGLHSVITSMVSTWRWQSTLTTKSPSTGMAAFPRVGSTTHPPRTSRCSSASSRSLRRSSWS